MKYTKDEAFEEVMKRGRILKLKHERKVTTLMTMAASTVMMALVLVIGHFGGVGAGMEGRSAYGSFLLPTQAGGYILVALVAFLLGVAVTLGIKKYRDHI